MIKLKPLHSEADYQEALAELHKFWHTTDPSEQDNLEVLAVLVDDYERRHTPIEPPEQENPLDRLAQQPGPVLPEVHFTAEELARISSDDDTYYASAETRALKPGDRVRHKKSQQTGNVNRILVEMAVDGVGTFTYNIDNIEHEST